MGAYRRWVAFRVTAALLLGAATAAEGASQRGTALPPCSPADPSYEPCQARYDVAPTVLREAPPPAAGGEQPRTSQVWVYVDSTGTVLKSQIHRPAPGPAGVAWDQAAVGRARQYRFNPAMLGGRPTGAWVSIPVVAVPRPQTCAVAAMSVPLSAGAQFVDSLVFDQPELGTAYRYRTPAGHDIDVYIYPRAPGTTPEGEVTRTYETLRGQLISHSPDSVSITRQHQERVRVRVRDRRPVIPGYGAWMKIWTGGEEADSYVGVFPFGDRYVKVRSTHPPTRTARAMTDEFIHQFLGYQAWRAEGCPR